MKIKRGIPLLLWVSLLFAGGCTHEKFSSPPLDAVIEAEFPAEWMEQMTFAYQDFKKNKKDISCFYVWTGKEDEEESPYFVMFTTKTDVAVEEGMTLVQAGEPENLCGRGRIYEFDSSGKFVRWHYIR